MSDQTFHMIIQRDALKLYYGSRQGIPYGLASGLEKDRLIARILHKILNLRLPNDESGVLGRDEFRVLGATLFKLLFNDEALQMEFNTFYKEALGSPDKRYRFVLEFEKEADELAALPWEYLYYEADEAHEAFLSAHPKKCLDFMRKLPYRGSWLDFDKAAFLIEAPLRVLVISADPAGSLPLQEQHPFFDYLQQQYPDRVDYRFLAQPEAVRFSEQLKQITQGFSPHIVHFIGHARMQGDSSELCFVQRQADDTFSESWIGEETFAGYFEEWTRLPHLVVLDIADGTPIGNYKNDKGLPIRLLRTGVPFVIGWQNPAPAWMTQLMIERMYTALLDGSDIAAAMTEARFVLARKLTDANGRKYDNYECKVFGSAMLFSSVLQPFALQALAPTDTDKPEKTPLEAYKVCPNHPQIKFIPAEMRCSLCNAPLRWPSQMPVGERQESRSAVSVESTASSVVEMPSTRSVSAVSSGNTSKTSAPPNDPKMLRIRSHLKKEISKDLLFAFRKLDEVLLDGNPSIFNEFINLNGQFNDINNQLQQDILDLIQRTEADRKINIIRISLIKLMDNIGATDLDGAFLKNFE